MFIKFSIQVSDVYILLLTAMARLQRLSLLVVGFVAPGPRPPQQAKGISSILDAWTELVCKDGHNTQAQACLFPVSGHTLLPDGFALASDIALGLKYRIF
jgi:hypothetical protein